ADRRLRRRTQRRHYPDRRHRKRPQRRERDRPRAHRPRRGARDRARARRNRGARLRRHAVGAAVARTRGCRARGLAAARPRHARPPRRARRNKRNARSAHPRAQDRLDCRPHRIRAGAPARRRGRASGHTLPAALDPPACRRLCRRSAGERGFFRRHFRSGMALAMSERKPGADSELIARVRAAARQEQFLEVVPAEEAQARFAHAIDLTPLPGERVPLRQALGRVLARDVVAAVDAPPFDRSNVDGFAVRAADTAGASEIAPKRLTLNAEVIACGHPPALEVVRGSATAIATGGVIPRGADAVIMIEHTELVAQDPPAIEVLRAAAAGQFVSYAGSDIARGETLLRKGTRIGSREIGMLAAAGLGDIEAVRKPIVAVLSTGDELVAPGAPLPPAGVYDSNGAILAAAVTEAGGEPCSYRAFPDDEAELEKAVRRALADC